MINIAKHHNLVGEVFGHLRVLAETKNSKGLKAWLVECDCENKTQLVIETGRLVSGKKRHCGCRKERKTRDKINLPEEYYIKTKECVQCGKDKKYAEYYFQECFDKDNNITYIFHTICIECSKENAKNRILNNRESHLESLRKNNKRENIKINKRLHSKKQREEGYQAQYQKDNPDKIREYARKHRNHDITTKEWESCLKFFEYKCAYCGISMNESKQKFKEKLHKEHVDHEGYNDIRNAVPACKSCNDKKWQFDMEEWFREQSFFTEDRLQKIIQWTTEEYKKYIEEKPPYRIKRSRVYNDDGTYYLQHELWSVDEKRNFVDIIATGRKKKDLEQYIKSIK